MRSGSVANDGRLHLAGHVHCSGAVHGAAWPSLCHVRALETVTPLVMAFHFVQIRGQVANDRRLALESIYGRQSPSCGPFWALIGRGCLLRAACFATTVSSGCLDHWALMVVVDPTQCAKQAVVGNGSSTDGGIQPGLISRPCLALFHALFPLSVLSLALPQTSTPPHSAR